MRNLVLLFSLFVCVAMSAQKINGADANVLMSGIGGSDKFVSTGTEITFSREIAAFKVVGTSNITVTSIKEGLRGQAGVEVPAGKYNYKDNTVTLKPGEIYIFSEYVIKITISNGGEILVNYRK
jgi:hypothetical protein